MDVARHLLSDDRKKPFLHLVKTLVYFERFLVPRVLKNKTKPSTFASISPEALMPREALAG